MSLTRSHFRAAPATDLVLVTHGSPSEPEPQERFVKALADEVAKSCALRVHGATLAAEGSLEAAVEGLDAPLIFPHFMADGWFVSDNLPKRLKEAGLTKWGMLPPLGLQPALPVVALAGIAEAIGTQDMTLVITAHGSPSDPRPARATMAFAKKMAESGRFTDVQVGYVDEEPSLEDALRIEGPSVLLPFFAAKAGHVLMDLPEAIEATGYSGTILEPIGTWADIPSLIGISLPEPAQKVGAA